MQYVEGKFKQNCGEILRINKIYWYSSIVVI
jgi:hypothetical protein